MRRMFWISALLALAAAVVLTGCSRREPAAEPETEPEEDGAVRDHSDQDAPKTFGSSIVVFFECEFSAVELAEDTTLEQAVYRLEARLENGAVKASYQRLIPGGDETKVPFRESHAFMRKISQIVASHDLAQYNGHHVHVSGLPAMSGASLSVRNADRESIDASDNQDNFLPIAAMEELESLFAGGIKE